MRILFASWPAHGHLLPMVPLIRAAQRAGHEIVVSSGADLQPVIDGLGVAFAHVGDDPRRSPTQPCRAGPSSAK